MDRNDQQAIEGLFQRLAEAERSSPQRDAEAESLHRAPDHAAAGRALLHGADDRRAAGGA